MFGVNDFPAGVDCYVIVSAMEWLEISIKIEKYLKHLKKYFQANHYAQSAFTCSLLKSEEEC